MKSIFDQKTYQEVLSRLDDLSAEHQAKWGKMNVNQMLKHCQKAILVAFGEEKITPPNVLVRFVLSFLKPTLYKDKPWKKGLPTAKEFVIVETDDFADERDTLKILITRFQKSEESFEPYKKHPVFGKLKPWMWGKWGYKHLDHHLKQFNV